VPAAKAAATKATGKSKAAAGKSKAAAGKRPAARQAGNAIAKDYDSSDDDSQPKQKDSSDESDGVSSSGPPRKKACPSQVKPPPKKPRPTHKKVTISGSKFVAPLCFVMSSAGPPNRKEDTEGKVEAGAEIAFFMDLPEEKGGQDWFVGKITRLNKGKKHWADVDFEDGKLWCQLHEHERGESGRWVLLQQ
jgi:hypothetical protein